MLGEGGGREKKKRPHLRVLPLDETKKTTPLRQVERGGVYLGKTIARWWSLSDQASKKVKNSTHEKEKPEEVGLKRKKGGGKKGTQTDLPTRC